MKKKEKIINERKENEYDYLKKLVAYKEKRGKEIQAEFDFEVPDYIIDEIIDREDKSIKDNIYMLVNLAVVNNRITEEQGEEIKNKVKTKKI